MLNIVLSVWLRCLLALGFIGGMGVAAADAQQGPRQHALSLLGTPKFGPDFKNFDWVNPNAPKGGSVRQWAFGSFDSLNPYPVKGSPATSLGLIHTTLMTSSPDEPSTEYGVLAEWVSHPDDYSSVTYGLRAGAKFHDGQPITPADVIFTVTELKRVSPNYAFYFKNVVKAEQTGEREVTFRFDVKNNRELPQIVGEIPVLPKHWWEAKDAKGEPRDLAKSGLEVPLGSGPYRIKAVDAGRSITYERVKDWWAENLPAMKGQYNFDELHFTYFREKVPAFESFKTGQLDFWRESSAKDWATRYDFDSVKRGFVKTMKLPVKTVAPMQAFAFNLRRPQFQDARVRRAFNHAFDFEWANKNLFYGEYTRVGSYFDNSELAAKGLPEGAELAILKEVEKDIPASVFTTPWANPANPSPEAARANLSAAAKLLTEAGWTPKGGVLTNAKGEQLTAEFLIASPDFERVALPYKSALEKLGVKAAIRLVDTAQYQRRNDSFDFDIIVASFGQSLSPGNEQREYWGSESAAREGSRNVLGIKNPAIDKLIDKVIFANDRAGLIAATRALDRVLLANDYVVPQWHLPFDRVAIWDRFERPQKLPSQAISFARVWWHDAAKAKALDEALGKR